jgi:hypothetical protein
MTKVVSENIPETKFYTCYVLGSGVLAIPSYEYPDVFVVPGGLTLNKEACVVHASYVEETLLWTRNWK